MIAMVSNKERYDHKLCYILYATVEIFSNVGTLSHNTLQNKLSILSSKFIIDWNIYLYCAILVYRKKQNGVYSLMVLVNLFYRYQSITDEVKFPIPFVICQTIDFI